jgi:hypothetical protein
VTRTGVFKLPVALAVASDPVTENVPVEGSYSSAPDTPEPFQPPRISTRPLGRSVAVWPCRAVAIEPVAEDVPVEGSYSSALLSAPPLLYPPTKSTFPFGIRVAVW